MNSSRRLLGACLAANLATVVPSQTPTAVADWRFPIRTQDADPVGGAYGTWASGPSYKVSFHDGFALYPILGSRYPENLPLRWHQTQITVGDEVLVRRDESPRHVHGDWRYEYRYAEATEAYDVLPAGVEQTFVIAHRPAARGDLVVRGTVTTRLHAGTVTAQHGPLVFRDHLGNAVLEYGAAFALDAAGQRFAMTTGHDGDSITLTLVAKELARAVFPLTIDPLTSVSTIATGASGANVQEPDIGRDTSTSGSKSVLFAYSRLASASDYDSYVRITDDDYNNGTVLFSDLSTTWSTRNNQVAFVGAPADQWVVVFQRDFPATTTSAIRYLLSPKGSTATVTTVYAAGAPSGYPTARNPDVGGMLPVYPTPSPMALIVFQCDNTTTNANTASTEVFGRILDLSQVTAPSLGPAFVLSATPVGTQFDRELPTCSQALGGAWVVAWQQYDNTIAGDDWDIRIAKISGTATIGGEAWLGNTAASDHAITPKLAGYMGRYTMTCATLANSGTKYAGVSGTALECQRFDWDTSASPTIFPTRSLAPATAQVSYVLGGIAIDTRFSNTSHWAVTWVAQPGRPAASTVHVARLGYSGGTVESATAWSSTSSGYSPSITYGDALFKLCFATDDSAESLRARDFRYDPLAVWATYGTGCGAATIESENTYAGNDRFFVTMRSAPAGVAAVLLISLAAQQGYSLAPIGMTGCWLNVSMSPGVFVASLPANTGPLGSPYFRFALPDHPPAVGNLYFQWAYQALGQNPLGVQATLGLVASVH